MGHHQRPEGRNTPVSVGRLSPGKPGAVRRDLGFAFPFHAVPSHLLSRMKNYAGCPGDLLGRRFPRVGLGCLARYQPPVHLSAQEVSPHRAYVQWRGRARDFPLSTRMSNFSTGDTTLRSVCTMEGEETPPKRNSKASSGENLLPPPDQSRRRKTKLRTMHSMYPSREVPKQ